MSLVYLLLGANLGDRFTQISNALREIEAHIAPIIKSSSLYQTEAWGKEEEPLYLNQVVCLESDLTPKALLKIVNTIEDKLGRTRKVKWESRIIDIDILFYDELILNEPELIIPHPYIAKRKFTLIPLAEIAADLIHPVLKKNVRELLLALEDPLEVKKIE